MFLETAQIFNKELFFLRLYLGIREENIKEFPREKQTITLYYIKRN